MRNEVFRALRTAADKLETIVADDLWPLPTYREMLFINWLQKQCSRQLYQTFDFSGGPAACGACVQALLAASRPRV